MTDPVPEGYTTLPEAVRRIVADLGDHEVSHEENQRLLSRAFGVFPRDDDDSGERPPKIDDHRDDIDPKILHNQREGRLAWARRRIAVHKLAEALKKGALASFVRDPVSGEMFRISTDDWHGANFFWDTIIGGVVQASSGDLIERYAGRLVLIEAGQIAASSATLAQWLKDRPRRRSIVAAEDCLSWLKVEMLAHPTASPQPIPWYRDRAKKEYGLTSDREFERLLSQAKRETGVRWKAGRRKKLPQ
jgi:hypothetical protein